MISLIAAVDKNMLIGSDGDLPWHYPEDLKYFKKLTLNHLVVMGRKTFYSIIKRRGNPLPNRVNIVASRDEGFNYPGVLAIKDLVSFLKTPHKDEIFIIGGYEIYKAALPYADRLYITHINKIYNGDVYFPSFTEKEFKIIDKSDSGDLSFCIYEKVKL